MGNGGEKEGADKSAHLPHSTAGAQLLSEVDDVGRCDGLCAKGEKASGFCLGEGSRWLMLAHVSARRLRFSTVGFSF